MFGAPISKNSVTSAPPATTDPQFNYVTALFNGDGTNGAQNNTFLDSSTNNFTITRNGTPTQGSAAPFGPNWSNYFNGSTDYLSEPSGVSSALCSGGTAGIIFTMEAWVYPTAWNGSGTNEQFSPIFAKGNTYFNFGLNTGYLKFYWFSGTANNVQSTSASISLNTWTHVALTVSTTAIKLYINGTQSGTGTFTGIVTGGSSTPDYTGFEGSGNTKFTGYISNARLVIGSTVYTANFTPPTSPLTAITNTKLLTCQSTYFKDNSTNNFTITPSGTPSVQRFSPFLNTASYSPSVYGGAMYFNGSTDWLVSPSNSALTLTGNFTLEAWIYVPSGTTTSGIISTYVSTATVGVVLGLISGSVLQIRVGTDSSGITVSDTVAITYNTWIHVAAVRNGTTLTLYKNGISVGTPTTTVFVPTTTTATIGKYYTDYAGFLFTGYISNARMLNGTALYTSNFTPPTAPLTAITNTALLLSGTNAGIYDSAMITTEITAGSAQISTTQKKYGTGSLYFTGTGAFLQAPNSPNYAFGTGAFTIECWVYPTTLASVTFVDTRASTTSTTGMAFGMSATGYLTATVNNFVYTSGLSPLTVNTWAYITIMSDGAGTITMFVDGVPRTNVTYSNNLTDQYLTIGNSIARTGTGYAGYMDDFRITKGYARYSRFASFTPPTQSLPTS
jgi:Concanavalin A-like lectin/glucanases superfamily